LPEADFSGSLGMGRKTTATALKIKAPASSGGFDFIYF